MHEGVDIRSVQRDKKGEPTDAVMAIADGVVVYANRRPALSNYGNYVVVRHDLDGIEIYSLYAHLSQVRTEVRAGLAVKAGENLGIMGRTSNTRESITRDRAHVHLELDLVVNDRFETWFKKACPGERNDHSVWNGQNLLGIDPRQVLLKAHEQGAGFSLLEYIQHETELCRISVRKTDFPWLRRYRALVKPNPVAAREGVAGYELALDFNGVPFEVIPRAASELNGKTGYRVLSVNEAEYRKNPARHLVVNRGGHWLLTDKGTRLLDLITY